jgi:hypothetical protein
MSTNLCDLPITARSAVAESDSAKIRAVFDSQIDAALRWCQSTVHERTAPQEGAYGDDGAARAVL